MTDEQDKILSMLEEGTISAEEADVLLAAVEEDVDDSSPHMKAAYPVGSPPDRGQVSEAWRLPFNISLVVAALSGSLLWRARRASRLANVVLTILLLPVMLVSGSFALFLYLSRSGPWLYMRIRGREGQRFAFSLPFPLEWARSAIQFIQSQEPDVEVREKLDMAGEFLAAVDSSDIQEPVSIDISDEGGRIEIYLVQ